MNAPDPATKPAWRRELRARVRALAPEVRQQAGAAIVQRLADLEAWRDARIVLLFHPLPGEPDLGPLPWRERAAGRTVALPRYRPDMNAFEACELHPDPARLVAGPFGTLEPDAQAARIDLNRLDFILVPGIGFTPDGRRLGRGKGYYDRLLSSVRGFACGVAFDEQMVDALPVEPHDVRVNCILTPSRCWLGAAPTVVKRC